MCVCTCPQTVFTLGHEWVRLQGFLQSMLKLVSKYLMRNNLIIYCDHVIEYS